MLDLGPERPGQASETRQMTEQETFDAPVTVSGRTFWILLGVIVLGLAAFAILR